MTAYLLIGWMFMVYLSPGNFAFMLWPAGSAHFHCYQLITYGFTHYALVHFVTNALALWSFGRKMDGPELLLVFFIGSVIGGGTQLLMYDPRPIVGASAGIMSVIGLYCYRHQKASVHLLGVIRIKCVSALMGLLYMTFMMMLFNWPDGVANAGHFMGLIVGVTWAAYVD